MKVAFIGLGIMGSRMAANLLKHNIDVRVYNRSLSPMETLEQKGAKSSSSPSEAVKEADVVFSMLSTPDVVKSVFINEGKALFSMKKGAIWVDCSTVNPSFSVEMHQQANSCGIHFIDGPVAGTKPQAENAELVFFVGGKDSHVQSVQPMLEIMGKKVVHLGDVGKGASFKMLVNLMLAESMLVFSESIILGERLGFDKTFLLNTIPNLIVAAPFTKFKTEMIQRDDYEVQFPLEWMHKDLQLVTQTANENQQPLFLANLVESIYGKAVEKGYSRLDFAAIHRFLEG